MNWILQESRGLATDEERVCISYAIAAHTHYLRDFTLEYGGVKYQISPYADVADGRPIYFVWLPRWVDRLDSNGPSFVARHFLTLAKEHDDYDGREFYRVDFKRHIEPVIRDNPTGPKTMLEHLKKFADSQNNRSPYGKYDTGIMVELRDLATGMLYSILEARNNLLPKAKAQQVVDEWFYFLEEIEPSPQSIASISKLRLLFTDLEGDIVRRWASIFARTMQLYTVWHNEITSRYIALDLPEFQNEALAAFVSRFLQRRR